MKEIKETCKTINSHFFNRFNGNLIVNSSKVDSVETLSKMLNDQGYAIYDEYDGIDVFRKKYLTPEVDEWIEAIDQYWSFYDYVNDRGLVLDVLINNESYYIMKV